MKKDIEILEVTGISIAIVPEKNASGENEWSVYFLNMKDVAVDSVLINAGGKGIVDGEERRTVTLRFFLKRVEARSYQKFELMMTDTFVLDNTYWVSFYEGSNIYDKKYLFAANTINEKAMTVIPLLEKPGIMAL